jgi:hypothetical protein
VERPRSEDRRCDTRSHDRSEHTVARRAPGALRRSAACAAWQWCYRPCLPGCGFKVSGDAECLASVYDDGLTGYVRRFVGCQE